ncbi:hypothetical protein OHB54_08375 [Streptomyces sp. NBC_01007]|nr:hypothetical protein OHB54_08375 [Streptomyces sp. NBC_01007]
MPWSRRGGPRLLAIELRLPNDVSFAFSLVRVGGACLKANRSPPSSGDPACQGAARPQRARGRTRPRHPRPRPEFNSLKYYRKVIGKYPLLSQRQEAESAQAIEAGVLAREKLDEAGRKVAPKLRRELELLARLGELAFTEFTHSNLRLVMSVAVRYSGRGLDLMDPVQEGNIGMIHAIEKFDHRKGFKFSTYVTQWNGTS